MSQNRCIKLREVGECAVIHVAPSWIYSAKVLAIHYNEEHPEKTVYDLDCAWIERVTNSVDLAESKDPNTVPGLQCRAGIQMSVSDEWISKVWHAHAHVTQSVNPTR